MEIRSEREAISMSQGELAKAIGMSQTTLSRIESGDRKATPGEEALVAAALTSNGTPPPPDEPPTQQVQVTTKCASYPAAPTIAAARRAYFAKRNTIMQTQGVKAPSTGTFGGTKKDKRT